jgi:hypothetical protein
MCFGLKVGTAWNRFLGGIIVFAGKDDGIATKEHKGTQKGMASGDRERRVVTDNGRDGALRLFEVPRKTVVRRVHGDSSLSFCGEFLPRFEGGTSRTFRKKISE